MSRSLGFSVVSVLAASVYFSLPAHAAGVDSQRYYFCEATNSFFPYVQTCAMPWKEMDPKPTVIASAQAPAVSTPPAPAPAAAPEPAAPRHGVVAFPIGMPPPQSAVATAPAQPAPTQVSAVAPGPVPLTPAESGLAKGPVVFAFGTEMPVIVCAVSQLCDLALQPGEKVNQIIVGDPDHWKIESVAEGAGYSETTHLIVRPTNPDLDTSLIVFTKMRTYHIQLKSHRKDYMMQVAFSYPGQEPGLAKPAVEKTAVDDSADDGLVKAGGITYVKGREPKMLLPKGGPDEPPLPAVPTTDVTEVPVSHSKAQSMPQ